MKRILAIVSVCLVNTPCLEAKPRFTEEREAAALHFVRKHLPELAPLLSELKRVDANRYQQEVCEIFQVTEMLADLLDEPRRHDLELKIWKTENKAYLISARLRASNDDDEKKLNEQLRELARELVGLDVEVMEVQLEQLKKEKDAVEEELQRTREQIEQHIKKRYENLLEKAGKNKK